MLDAVCTSSELEAGRDVILTIAIMTALTVAVAAYALAPRMAEGRVIFRQEPDGPRAFGYKMAWLAVRTRDPQAVVEELGFVSPRRATGNRESARSMTTASARTMYSSRLP